MVTWCSTLPLEIGSRGHITARNRETIIHLCHTLKIGKFSNVIKCCSKLALLGSYSIFIGRNSSDWSGSGLLKPWISFLPSTTIPTHLHQWYRFKGVHIFLCTPMCNHETDMRNCLAIWLWIQQDKILGVIVSICALYFCNKAVNHQSYLQSQTWQY